MAEKPNQQANFQSSKLDENKLHKLEEESRRQSESKFAFLSLDRFMYVQAKRSVSFFVFVFFFFPSFLKSIELEFCCQPAKKRREQLNGFQF